MLLFEMESPYLTAMVRAIRIVAIVTASSNRCWNAKNEERDSGSDSIDDAKSIQWRHCSIRNQQLFEEKKSRQAQY